jgi:hypothetical protein
MGLLDGYFDPDEFNPSGGLIGRLTSLQQQQDQYQPSPGFGGSVGQPAQVASVGVSGNAVPQVGLGGPTSFMQIGDYQMPQFGTEAASQATQPTPPGLGDRLAAAFQNWAHTPLENPVAAIANGIKGFGAGQPTDANRVVPSQPQMPVQAPDLGGRLNAGFQSWAHTPAGNPFAGLANGITGFNSGQQVNQEPAPQASRGRSEMQQPPSPVIQDAALMPMNLQAASKSAPRVMVGPVAPRANPWKPRYGQ